MRKWGTNATSCHFFNAELIEITPKLAPTSRTKLDGSTQLSIQLAKGKPAWFVKLFIVYVALLLGIHNFNLAWFK